MQDMTDSRVVTKGEDGVYRWSYEMDMFRNLNLRNTLLRITGTVCAIALPCWIFIFSMDGHSLSRLELVSCVSIAAALMLLVLISYYIAALILRGKYTVHFAMSEEAIQLVRKPSTERFMNSMLMVIGKTGQNKGYASGKALNTMEGSGLTLYSDVFRMKCYRKYDSINLNCYNGGNQIWVRPEDYDFVCDYIASHLPEKAKIRR